MTKFPPIGELEWTDELVESLWDYYSTMRPETFFTANFGDRILDVTSRFVPDGATVCDYGCGRGYLLKRIVEDRKGIGVDFSGENRTAVGAELAGNPNFLGVYAPDEMTATDHRVDVVYFVETVEHVLDQHMASTLASIRRMLKPGGIVICTTPHDEDLSLEEVFCPVTRRTFHKWQHVRSFTQHSLAALFAEHGFHGVETFTTDFMARTAKARLKAMLRPRLGRKNPHLVYVGTPADD